MANVENLRILQLSTGEDIIAEVLVHDTKVCQVKNPVRIVMIPSKADPKNPSVGFAPFLQWSDDKELTLNANHVISSSTPIAEFVNQYNGMFGGLVVPPKSGLITP